MTWCEYLVSVNFLFPAYHDYDDATFPCPDCGALMWFFEKVQSTSSDDPEFSICCRRGKIKLDELVEAPRPLCDYLSGKHKDSRKYLDNIIGLNMMFAFTSMGGTIDRSVNKGGGPYSYRLGGQNYHLLGSLLPKPGKNAKFSQLYMFSGEDETRERIDALR